MPSALKTARTGDPDRAEGRTPLHDGSGRLGDLLVLLTAMLLAVAYWLAVTALQFLRREDA